MPWPCCRLNSAKSFCYTRKEALRCRKSPKSPVRAGKPPKAACVMRWPGCAMGSSMKPTLPEDREAETTSPEISEHYRAGAHDEPSARVDAAIREAARRD